MNHEEFEACFEDQVQKCREVLVNKAGEYAVDGDRLHNFIISAPLMGGTPEKAAWGFMVKHLTSLSDMVASGTQYPIETWDEKLGDAMNYLFLLKAIVVERELKSERTRSLSVSLNDDPIVVNNHISNK